jgi:oligopeptidase B
LEEENAYIKAVMAPTEKLQATIHREMISRLQQDESSVPRLDGPFGYFRRYEEGNEHPMVCRISREDFESGAWTQDSPLPPSNELLLDANQLAANLTFFSLGAAEHSPNHQLLAYATDTKGSEYYTIEVKNLKDGSMLSDSLVNASSSMAWSADSQHIFYTMLDDNHREKWVYRHKLGTPQDQDHLVYEEDDDGFFVGVGVTDSNKFITIESNDHATSEVRLVPADKPESAALLVQVSPCSSSSRFLRSLGAPSCLLRTVRRRAWPGGLLCQMGAECVAGTRGGRAV